MDNDLYEKCSRENVEKVKLKEGEREAASARWLCLMQEAKAKGFDDTAIDV
jgi:hypothetical protein